jgi:hypothetical protein
VILAKGLDVKGRDALGDYKLNSGIIIQKDLK